MSTSKLLLVEEVAAICRVPVSTVRYWLFVGKLPSVRPGRRRLVREDELERFLARGAGHAGSQGGAP